MSTNFAEQPMEGNSSTQVLSGNPTETPTVNSATIEGTSTTPLLMPIKPDPFINIGNKQLNKMDKAQQEAYTRDQTAHKVLMDIWTAESLAYNQMLTEQAKVELAPKKMARPNLRTHLGTTAPLPPTVNANQPVVRSGGLIEGGITETEVKDYLTSQMKHAKNQTLSQGQMMVLIQCFKKYNQNSSTQNLIHIPGFSYARYTELYPQHYKTCSEDGVTPELISQMYTQLGIPTWVYVLAQIGGEPEGENSRIGPRTLRHYTKHNPSMGMDLVSWLKHNPEAVVRVNGSRSDVETTSLPELASKFQSPKRDALAVTIKSTTVTMVSTQLANSIAFKEFDDLECAIVITCNIAVPYDSTTDFSICFQIALPMYVEGFIVGNQYTEPTRLLDFPGIAYIPNFMGKTPLDPPFLAVPLSSLLEHPAIKASPQITESLDELTISDLSIKMKVQ